MNFESMSEAQFNTIYSQIVDKIIEDPIENFIKNPQFLNTQPSPTQEVILKVVFQKKLNGTQKREVFVEIQDINGKFKLIPTQMTEVEIYEFLTESAYEPDTLKQFKINKINLICGRRSGKTLLAAIIAIFCAITTNWKPFLGKKRYATVLILSHSKEFTEEILDDIKKFIEESPILQKLVNKHRKQTASAFNLRMPFYDANGKLTYSLVQIKAGAASSKTTRGVAACAVICDEIAFWNLDENMKETDIKIMKAVRPAIKQFKEYAMLIKLSSPSIKQGVLYNEYLMARAGNLPKTYATFKSPTWMMNNILEVKEYYEEYQLDPEGFDTEYRANFVDSMSNFFSIDKLEQAIIPAVTFQAPSGDRNTRYYAAIDAAFKADRFTFSVIGVTENRVTQYISKGFEGTRENPVQAHQVASWIKNAIKGFNIQYISADQFAFQPLKEIFSTYGLVLRENTFTPVFKRKIYYNLKKLINSQQIDLLDNQIQTKELKELIVQQSASGTIKISHPNGGTDDFTDSLAVACFLGTEVGVGTKFEFKTTFYGEAPETIVLDKNGVSIKAAPTAEMLSNSGHLSENVVDNSSLFAVDPKDGKLKPIFEIDNGESDDGDSHGFQFSF